MKLSPKEALEARQRRLEYEHSLAIEGLALTPEERAFLETLDRDRVGYEEGVRQTREWLRQRGVLPATSAAAE